MVLHTVRQTIQEDELSNKKGVEKAPAFLLKSLTQVLFWWLVLPGIPSLNRTQQSQGRRARLKGGDAFFYRV